MGKNIVIKLPTGCFRGESVRVSIETIPARHSEKDREKYDKDFAYKFIFDTTGITKDQLIEKLAKSSESRESLEKPNASNLSKNNNVDSSKND